MKKFNDKLFTPAAQHEKGKLNNYLNVKLMNY